MKNVVKFSLVFILALCVFFPVFAQTPSPSIAPSGSPNPSISHSISPNIEPTIAEVSPFDIKAKSYVLMEEETGTVLYQFNEKEKLPIASVTKIMTALLAAEAVNRGDVSLNTEVSTSEYAASMGGSQVFLEPNEKMSLRDMLKAMMVASANDAAVAVAEKIAGTENAFVARMNERAKKLGMINTKFITSNGLDKNKVDGYSTSLDVAIMSRELLKYDFIIKDSQIWMDTLRNGAFGISNTNKMLKQYEGTIGLKTGSTQSAKYCLSAVAKRNGITYIAVILGADTPNDRWNGAKQLLDYGFTNYEKYEDKSLSKVVVKIDKGKKRAMSLEIEGGGACIVPKADKNNIRVETDIPKTISAPIKKGEKCGTVKFYVGDKLLREAQVYTTENIAKLNIWGGIRYIFEQLFTLERAK